MKRIMCIALILLSLPLQAFAEIIVASNTYYVSYKDQYRIDYTAISAASYQLHFTNSLSEVYTVDYAFTPTGIHFLTCNGTYKINFFDGTGVLIGQTAETVTTAIINPTCSSYSGETGGNDFVVTENDFILDWEAVPGAANYEVWKDGILDGTTTDSTYNLNGSGSIAVIAKDGSDAIVGESNFMVSENVCEVCDKLTELLNCPDWDLYMSEFTQAFANALPPAPDWEAISELIGAATVSHLSDYLGDVPISPTQTEIDNQISKPLPTIDTTFTNATNLVPSVPSGYETEKEFDISSGVVIEVYDNSVPFQIFNPLSNLIVSDPGIPIIPGDVNNNTGGIATPMNTTYPIVTPRPMTSALPNNPIPTPNSTSSTGATPSIAPIGSANPAPTPNYPGGWIYP